MCVLQSITDPRIHGSCIMLINKGGIAFLDPNTRVRRSSQFSVVLVWSDSSYLLFRNRPRCCPTHSTRLSPLAALALVPRTSTLSISSSATSWSSVLLVAKHARCVLLPRASLPAALLLVLLLFHSRNYCMQGMEITTIISSFIRQLVEEQRLKDNKMDPGFLLLS